MAKQVIGIGSAANDRTGDKLRVAFDKINDNFTEVYSAIAALGSLVGATGPTGLTGATGPQGATGIGDIGATGATGPVA